MDFQETHDIYPEFNPAIENPISHENAFGESDSGEKNPSKTSSVFKALKYAVIAATVTATVIFASGASFSCSLRSVTSTAAYLDVNIKNSEDSSYDESFSYILYEAALQNQITSDELSPGKTLLIFEELTPETKYKIVFTKTNPEGSETAAEFYFTTTKDGVEINYTDPALDDQAVIGLIAVGLGDNIILTEPEASLTLSVSGDNRVTGNVRVTANDAEITGEKLLYEGAYFSTLTPEQLLSGNYFYTDVNTTGGVRTFTLFADYTLGGKSATITVTRSVRIDIKEDTVIISPVNINSFALNEDGLSLLFNFDTLPVNSVIRNNPAGVTENTINLSLTLNGAPLIVSDSLVFTNITGSQVRVNIGSEVFAYGPNNAGIELTYMENGVVKTLSSSSSYEKTGAHVDSFTVGFDGTVYDIAFTTQSYGVSFVSGYVTYQGVDHTITASEYSSGSLSLSAPLTVLPEYAADTTWYLSLVFQEIDGSTFIVTSTY